MLNIRNMLVENRKRFFQDKNINVTIDSLMCMSSRIPETHSIVISKVFYRYKLHLNTEAIKLVAVLLELARFSCTYGLVKRFRMSNDLRILNLWHSTKYPGSSYHSIDLFKWVWFQWHPLRPIVFRIKRTYFIQFHRGMNRFPPKTSIS